MGAGAITMKEIAGTLKTVSEKVEKIDESVDAIKDTQWDMKEKQAEIRTHLKGLIDPPNLETRLKDYIDERDEHKQNSATQALLQVQQVLKLQQENSELKLAAQIKDVALAQAQTERDRASNHHVNTSNADKTDKRLSKLERVYYIGIGIVIALQFVLKFVHF